MAEARSYDRSYKEQAIRTASEIGNMFRHQPSEVCQKERMKFTVLKTDNGKLKVKFHFIANHLMLHGRVFMII